MLELIKRLLKSVHELNALESWGVVDSPEYIELYDWVYWNLLVLQDYFAEVNWAFEAQALDDCLVFVEGDWGWLAIADRLRSIL